MLRGYIEQRTGRQAQVAVDKKAEAKRNARQAKRLAAFYKANPQFKKEGK